MRKKRTRSFWERSKRACRYYYLKILRLNDPPDKIALGVAIGVFIGFMPTVGLATIFAIFFAHIFKVNKAAAFLGTFVMNPISTPIVWSLSYSLGRLIYWRESASAFVHGKITIEGFKTLIQTDGLAFFTGNFIISATGAIVAYHIVLRAVIRRREKKSARKFKKRLLQSEKMKPR